jgi:RNA polymerase sigma-54 factor
LTLQTKDQKVLTLLPHLDLVAKRDFKALMAALNMSQDEVIKAIEALKKLNPKPALGFSTDHLNRPPPDVLVIKNKENAWEARLNAEIQPKITINSRLRQQLNASQDKASLEWGKTLTHNATALFKMMGNRNDTLLKVASEIVKIQSDYFEQGAVAIKPLTLKQVAEVTGFHESTISRAISHKTLISDKGMVELKFFFSTSLGDEGSSSEAIKSRIKTLIEGETKAYSDDKLVELLAIEGVHVARRTVTKYRESMNIASSVLRNRDKMFA